MKTAKDYGRASQPPAASQPTLYQYRMRPSRNNAIGWTAWKDCSEWSVSGYEYPPKPCDWHYEVRRLYATPQPPAASQPSDTVDAARYRFLEGKAYECVVPHGNKVDGSRTAWITKLHAGSTFSDAIDRALAAVQGKK